MRIRFTLLLCLILGLTSCSKKTTPEGPAETARPAISETDIGGGVADSDSGKAMGLQTVHFAFDSAALDPTAKSTLNDNAKILKNNAGLKVQLEGHCDERGGIQYNLALGERRANSTKAYLADHGVSRDRLSVISYGKEKPLDPGHDEAAWAKNRRANFRVTEK